MKKLRMLVFGTDGDTCYTTAAIREVFGLRVGQKVRLGTDEFVLGIMPNDTLERFVDAMAKNLGAPVLFVPGHTYTTLGSGDGPTDLASVECVFEEVRRRQLIGRPRERRFMRSGRFDVLASFESFGQTPIAQIVDEDGPCDAGHVARRLAAEAWPGEKSSATNYAQRHLHSVQNALGRLFRSGRIDRASRGVYRPHRDRGGQIHLNVVPAELFSASSTRSA